MSSYTSMHGALRIYDSTDDLRAAAAKSVVDDDNGVYADLSTNARSAAGSLTGAILAHHTEDEVYIGSATPFCRINVDVSTAAIGTGTLIAHYWDGSSWTALTIDTDGTDDGTDTFAQDGVIDFKAPSDWAAGDGGVGSDLNSAFYYVRLRGTTTPGTPPNCEQLWPVDGQYFACIFDEGNLTAPEGRARPEENIIFHRGRGDTNTHYVMGPDNPIFDPLELSFSFRLDTTYTNDVWYKALTCGNPNVNAYWDAAGVSTKATTKLVNGAGTSVTTPAFEDSEKKAVDIQIIWERNSVKIGRAYHETWFAPDQLSMAESEDGVIVSVTGMIYGLIEVIYYFGQQY